MKRRRMALAARSVLEARAGEWVSSIELIRAGVEQPAAAIAYARDQLGLVVEQDQGPGGFNRYRLTTAQLGLGLGQELPQ